MVVNFEIRRLARELPRGFASARPSSFQLFAIVVPWADHHRPLLLHPTALSYSKSCKFREISGDFIMRRDFICIPNVCIYSLIQKPRSDIYYHRFPVYIIFTYKFGIYFSMYHIFTSTKYIKRNHDYI